METASNETKACPRTPFSVGGRFYEAVPFCLNGGPTNNEQQIGGDTLVERAEVLQAALGEDDGKRFIEFQNEIPAIFRDYHFVFTKWSDHPNHVMVVHFRGNKWQATRSWLGEKFPKNGLLPRRVASTRRS